MTTINGIRNPRTSRRRLIELPLVNITRLFLLIFIPDDRAVSPTQFSGLPAELKDGAVHLAQQGPVPRQLHRPAGEPPTLPAFRSWLQFSFSCIHSRFGGWR